MWEVPDFVRDVSHEDALQSQTVHPQLGIQASYAAGQNYRINKRSVYLMRTAIFPSPFPPTCHEHRIDQLNERIADEAIFADIGP